MGQDLTYNATSANFVFPLSRSDWELMQSLRTHLPDEIEVLFAVPELGVKVVVPVTTLRASAERLSSFIEQHGELLPYTYQFKCERTANPSIPAGGFGAGRMSGIRLTNDKEHFYSIRAGFDECNLRKLAIGEDGRGIEVEIIDLRQTKELSTDSHGTIKIKRTRKKTDLSVALAEILDFLDRLLDTTIEKSIQ